MKKLVVLSAILFLFLTACSLTFKYNPMIGRRFKVAAPEQVIFYREPSFKSEPFYLEKPDEFTVEVLECSEHRIGIACALDMTTEKYPENVESAFFKVKFSSGKEGYISYKDLSPATDTIIDIDAYNAFAPRVYPDADYDRVWKASIDTLDEQGFVIAHMRKGDGYIATYMKNDINSRRKVTIRLSRLGRSVEVSISEYSEELKVFDKEGNRFFYYWSKEPPSGPYRQMLQDKIASKVYKDAAQ